MESLTRHRDSVSTREWDWIFSSLWTACGRENQGCRLNVPQTVLFKHGEPRKWVSTSASGHVTRISFGRPPPGARGSGRAQHRMRVVHAALSEAAELAGLPEDGPAVVAWYADTGKEEIDLKTLSMLMKHADWRMQLVALQAYVRAEDRRQGEYDPGKAAWVRDTYDFSGKLN